MANQGAWFHYNNEVGPRFQPVDNGHSALAVAFGFCARNTQAGPVGSAICSSACGQHPACSCGLPASHPIDELVDVSGGPTRSVGIEPERVYPPIEFPTSRDLFTHILLQLAGIGPNNQYAEATDRGLKKFGLVPERYSIQAGVSPQEILLLGLLAGYLEKLAASTAPTK